MLRKNIRNYCIFLICIALGACAVTQKSAQESGQVSVVHLTRPTGTQHQNTIQEGTLTNPQQSGNVITGTADVGDTPLARIESADGYAPDSASILSVDKEEVGTKIIPEQIQVQKGDTVYALARRYNTKIDDIAKLNDLDDSYTIVPGQMLLLPVGTNMEKLAKKEQPQTTPKPAAASASSASVKLPSRKVGGISWSWPLAGKPKVLRGFGSDGGNSKGIDLAGEIGDPVYAVSDGTVVYSGNKLKGYGNLIIISHRNNFMSTYAHNSKLLVASDDEVKRGQKIAEVGAVESKNTKLFFQVRSKGEPVDPISYLPKR